MLTRANFFCCACVFAQDTTQYRFGTTSHDEVGDRAHHADSGWRLNQHTVLMRTRKIIFEALNDHTILIVVLNMVKPSYQSMVLINPLSRCSGI